MKWLASIALSALSALTPQHANAECHFGPIPVIACQSPVNAVRAFRTYGHSMQYLRDPANRQMLINAGCTLGTTGDLRNVKVDIKTTLKTQIDGEVTTIQAVMINGAHYMYVADGYITGKCNRNRPPEPPKTYTMPIDGPL